MTDMLASKRGWAAKLRDLEHANVWRPQRMKHTRTDAVWLHEQEHRGEKRRKHKVEVYIMRPVVQIIQPQVSRSPTVAKLFSFLSAALASTGFFCYFGVASNSVVLILPGFIVLWIPRDHVTQYHLGSLRMYCGVVYLLFIGFGLAIGAEAYEKITSVSHDANGPWWPRTKSLYWAFLTVPIYSLLEYAEPGAGVEQGDDPEKGHRRVLRRLDAQAPQHHCHRRHCLGPRRASASPSTSPSAARPCPPARSSTRRGPCARCSQHELAAPRRPSEHVQLVRDGRPSSATPIATRARRPSLTRRRASRRTAAGPRVRSPTSWGARAACRSRTRSPCSRTPSRFPVMGLLHDRQPH
ncbi:hypothetical protein B0H14DRAFT_3178643 [Mycena olivaceomarginata]|nr:hypothetical protein B0H14DRAFT_3178643 [Mycena olivaceomarginata]